MECPFMSIYILLTCKKIWYQRDTHIMPVVDKDHTKTSHEESLQTSKWAGAL